jgi:hypothetical protein
MIDTTDPLAENEESTWRRRWITATADLTEARAECLRLRVALDELNLDTEQAFSRAGQEGVESAKSWLIKQLRKNLTTYRKAQTS